MKTKIISIFVSIALVLVALPALASTFFVDFAGGSDANPGTLASPFKTIPGTRKADDSGYLNTTWGSFTTSARVPDNTAFIIKTGTTETTNGNSGYVWMTSQSSGLYNQGCTNIVIGVTNNFGTGTTASIDATNMTVPIAAFLIQIDGVTVNGLNISNSPLCGMQIKDKPGGGPETNSLVLNCNFYNCGWSIPDENTGAGKAVLQVKSAYGLFITNCFINGNSNWINGIICGDTGFYVGNAFIANSTLVNLRGGSFPESGIGIKCFNSQVTMINITAHETGKGLDLGEDSGLGSNIVYKVINCTLSNNLYGCNFNNEGFNANPGDVPGPASFYLINCLIISNSQCGSYNYAGPFKLYVVNNVFDGNGSLGGTFAPQLAAQANGDADTNHIEFYSYNNIFQNAQAYQYITGYYSSTNDVSWFVDYNSYNGNGLTTFTLWSLNDAPPQVSFTYGANGPGHASGNWYSWYANNGTRQSVGTGHFNDDPHSKGTGATDTSLPSFGANYALLAPYPGANLSTNSWFIPEMGIDRNGNQRLSWNMGPSDGLATNLTINASTNIMVIGSGGNLTINGAIQTNGVTATDGTGTTTLIGTPFTMTVGTYTYSPPISSFGTTPGPFNFTVTYIGNYGTLTSATININLVQFATTLTVTSSGSPALAGSSVTFTASGFTNSNPIIPATGLVAFRDTTTSTSLGSVAISSGQAQITTSSLGLGTHVIQAIYSGDANYTLATNTFSQVMTANTNLVITISPNPASASPLQVVNYGLSVLTNGVVDISYSGISYVYVFNGVNIISQQSGNPTSGTASFTAAASNVGFTNAVATLAFSSITLTSNIIPFRQVAFGTTLTIVPSANPSIFGNAVTFTANCFTNGLPIIPATGLVDFLDGSTPLGSVAISSGKAQIGTSGLSVGTHTIKAIYEGDSNYTPATNTLSQQVNNPITGGGLQAFILGHFQGNITTH